LRVNKAFRVFYSFNVSRLGERNQNACCIVKCVLPLCSKIRRVSIKPIYWARIYINACSLVLLSYPSASKTRLFLCATLANGNAIFLPRNISTWCPWQWTEFSLCDQSHYLLELNIVRRNCSLKAKSRTPLYAHLTILLVKWVNVLSGPYNPFYWS